MLRIIGCRGWGFSRKEILWVIKSNSEFNILKLYILIRQVNIIIRSKFNMHKFSNPEESEHNPNFLVKSLKVKLKNLPSSQISNYSIKQKIGMGSYAKVYKAIHRPTGELVAVKVLNKARMTNQEIKNTYFEVQIQKKLFHTNVARIYEIFENEQKIFIFMELCPNGELFNYINKNGPLSQKFASKVFKQILSALKYLKSQRIFHRDIKCQNIMFDRNWNAKLVDFGFVTKEEDGSFSNTFCGSPSYTAPELAKRQAYQSEKVDVWCLGVALYAMIAGQLPFDGSDRKDTKKNIIEINYEMKKFFSGEVKEVFSKIFIEDSQRASIEELQKVDFIRKGFPVSPNFINTNIDEIVPDPNILELIQAQFKIGSSEVIESVLKFKLDSNYSLYYLVVQREILRGNKVKFDIACADFQKRKKRSAILRLLKIKNQSKRRNSRPDFQFLETPETSKRKQHFRIRLTPPCIDIQTARLRKRDQSPESPKRILDLMSAYRQRM